MQKHELSGTAMSVLFDLVLFSISGKEIHSSNANSKFSSGIISHYPFLALFEFILSRDFL